MAEPPSPGAPGADIFDDVTSDGVNPTEQERKKDKKKKSVSKKWEKQLLEHYDGRYWQLADGAKREPKRKRHYDDFLTDDGFFGMAEISLFLFGPLARLLAVDFFRLFNS
jgi:hypothetical protein